MWDILRVRPLGRLSRRSFFAGVAALLLAFFTATTISTGIAYAAPDITWDGQGNPVYQNNTYAGPMSGSNLPSVVPADATAAYEYIPQTGTTIDILYFPKGSDPTSATAADFITATDQNGVYSNASQPQQLSATPTPQSSNNSGSSACNVTGIGWIICPVSQKLAEGMDYLFGVLTDFLKVAPLSTDTNNVIYRGWATMRNLANVAFIIAFLIIVYSQITTYGISNYGVKKMLPRIIIAAILMNISYWICAAGVDLSNISAVSFENMFMDLYRSLINGAGNASVPTWQAVTAGVLGGSAILAGGAAILVTSGGVLALLIPALVGVALSALVAVIVLAARQALIVILIIVSPFAFVAYLLPNTEKYFHKWRELFTTMLLMFPIFAFLFGGAQLAGAAIMQSSHNIVTLLLGMTVQVVPIAITPFLLKFSGNLLNQLAGRVSGRHKGLVDRTRAWAKGANERQMIRGAERGNKMGQRWIGYSDGRAKRDERYKARRANLYNATGNAMRHAEVMDAVQAEAKRLEGEHEIHLKARLDPKDVHFNRQAFERHLEAESAHDRAELGKQRFETAYAEIRAGDRSAAISRIASSNDVYSRIVDTSQNVALTSMRKKMAERQENSAMADALLTNTKTIDGKVLRDYAGGVLGDVGAEAVLSNAITAQRKEYGENVENKKQLIKHFNLSGAQRQDLAMGRNEISLLAADSSGHTYQFKVDDSFAREAAIEAQLGGEGNFANMEEIIAQSGSGLSSFKTTISSMVVQGKIADKGAYLGGKSIDDIAQGKIGSDADINALVIRSVAQGKIKPAQLATMDKDAIERIVSAVTAPTKNVSMLNEADQASLANEIRNLSNSANEALTVPDLVGSVAQNVKPLLERLRSLHSE